MLPGLTAIRSPVLESDIKIRLRAIIDKIEQLMHFQRSHYLVKLNKW